MSSRDQGGLPPPIRADLAKGAVTAVLLPLTLGLVAQPLLLPQFSLPPSPAVWLPGLLLTVVGLVVTSTGLRTLAAFFRGAEHGQPRELCTVGPFAYVRNPIYVGGVIFVAGLGLVLLSSLVLLYAAFLWIGFHVLVVRIEEPAMRNRFPEDYAAYVRRTPRWLPQLRR